MEDASTKEKKSFRLEARQAGNNREYVFLRRVRICHQCATRDVLGMGDAPAVVRVFWPHPSLPRISSEGGEDARSAGTEDEGPALVLVGW